MKLNIELAKHNSNFADRIFTLSSASPVKDALGLNVTSVEDTKKYIKLMIKEEETGTSLSRVILNEQKEVIGVTTLMNIDYKLKRCHIGTWIGYEYWGKGYNQASKIAILDIAFNLLGLQHVFAGAKKDNIRSQKAQEKLPFITLHVESEFPEEHTVLENRVKQPCILHVFAKDNHQAYIRKIE